MPSEEELRKARSEEREDGWGILPGIEEAWLDLPDHSPSEATRLDSGLILKHHRKENCSGRCCLHGTSPYASCKMPRQWRTDKGILEHVCSHCIVHPCRAGLEYAEVMGQHHDGGVHRCDGCCMTDEMAVPEQADDRMPSPEFRLAAVEGKIAVADIDIELHDDWIMQLDDRIDGLRTRFNTLTWLYLSTICAFGILYFFK